MPGASGTIIGGRRTGSTLPGSPPLNYDPSFGGIPQVPDPGASAGSAISANMGNLGPLYGLAGGVNRFNQGQLIHNLETGLPEYGAMTATSSENILQNLHGQLSPDVLNLLAQQGAERGVATGTSGSPNANAAFLRALGLTSLDLQRTGEQELTGAIGRTPMAPLFNLPSMLTTPDEIQQAQMAANLYKSAPVPSRAATAGAGAFGAGMSAGGGAVGPPNVDYRMGPGGGRDWALDMYNAPWASDVANPPALFGSGVDTGTGEPGAAAWSNWNKERQSWYTPPPAEGTYNPDLVDYSIGGPGETYGNEDYFGQG